MNTLKITSELDLGSIACDFLGANGHEEDVLDGAGKDRQHNGYVTFDLDGERCEIVSTKTQKVSNKYEGFGGWKWAEGDQASEIGQLMTALMAQLNGEAVAAPKSKYEAPANIERTRDLKEIADTLNTIAGMPKAGYFDKGSEPRIYLNVGYNTKKVTTKAWLSVRGDEVIANVKVRGEDHNGFQMAEEWCASEAKILMPAVEEIAAFVQDHLLASSGDSGAEVDQVLNDEALLDTVFGVIPQWRETRVAINRFGKLATRHRLFLRLWSGTKIQAPAKLVQITAEMHAFALANWKDAEKMCEPGPSDQVLSAALFALESAEAHASDVQHRATNN